MRTNRVWVLYLGFPIALALFNGIRGTVWSPDMAMPKTILMFVICSLQTYGFAALSAHFFLRLTHKIGCSPVWALVASALITIPFSYYVVVVFIRLFGDFYPSLEPLLDASGLGLIDGLGGYVTKESGILLGPIWIGSHYIYERLSNDVLFFKGVLKEPKSQNDQAPEISIVDVNSISLPFLHKIQPYQSDSVLALEAQEHYVRIHTDNGGTLVLYRFGDAVHELSQVRPGLRVHRSHWVAEDAISAVVPSGKTYCLRLVDGRDVPVSKAYKKVIENYISRHQSFLQS